MVHSRKQILYYASKLGKNFLEAKVSDSERYKGTFVAIRGAESAPQDPL